MVALNSFQTRIDKSLDAKFLAGEVSLWKDLSQTMSQLRNRQKLAEICGIHDDALVERIYKAGLDADSVEALLFFPLAEIAWASGRVSNTECDTAIAAICDADLAENFPAIRQFRAWLARKPSKEMSQLWRDYMIEKLHSIDQSQRTAIGLRLMNYALAIAQANGGMFGIGRVCRAERVVLDRIKRMFGLADHCLPKSVSLAALEIATTAGCFSRRSSEIA